MMRDCSTKPEPPAQEFTATNLPAQLAACHPRLILAGPAAVESLRRKVRDNPLVADWAARLRLRAEVMAAPKPELVEDKPPRTPETKSRTFMVKLLTLSLMHLLDRNPAYLRKATELLRSAAGEAAWGGIPHKTDFCLNTSITVTAAALALDWLHNELEPELRTAVGQAIISNGLAKAFDEYAKPPVVRYWPDRNNNWNQVCNGGVILGALAVAETAPEMAARALNLAIETLPNSMNELAPDGGHEEGPGYWGFGMRWFAMAWAALESALGRPQPLADNTPGLPETGEFQIHTHGPAGQAFNYADCGDEDHPAPQLFWLATRFNRPDYNWNELRRIARHFADSAKKSDPGLPAAPAEPLDIIWYEPTLDQPANFAPPLDRRFVRHEVVCMRGGWSDPQTLFVACKGGGARGVSGRCLHTQLDAGSFVFDALGERWALDLGADSYGLPGYFENWPGSQFRRFSYYRNRAEGHNTLVLNPHLQPQQDVDGVARFAVFKSTPDECRAVCDLSPVYTRQAASVRRGTALLDGRRQLLVQDEARADGPLNLWWFMHTRAEIEIIADGRGARLRLNGKELLARIAAGDNAKFTVMDAQPMAAHSPNPAGQNQNPGIRKLTVHLEYARNPLLAVLLTPLQTGETPETCRPVPVILPLDNWI